MFERSFGASTHPTRCELLSADGSRWFASEARRSDSATYEPGWRWSTHVGPALGLSRCPLEHLGLVLCGVATAAFDDGDVKELHAGDLFHIGPVPHDSWVVGDEPYVSLHFLRCRRYATTEG